MPATWAFTNSTARALDEAVLAIIATAIAIAFAWLVWRTPDSAAMHRRAEFRPILAVFAAFSAVAIVVRQTIEIGYVLQVAALQVRSLNATVDIVAAVALAILLGGVSIAAARGLSAAALKRAARTFAAVFLVQTIVYAVHQSSEARFVPWSEVVHEATEPYGPDGVYGMHFSELLLILPMCAALMERRERLKPVASAPIVAIVIGLGAWSLGHITASAAPVPDLQAVMARPHLLFRETGKGANFGLLSAAALDAPDGPRVAAGVSCDRVGFAAGTGICLHGEPAFFGLFVGYTALILDRDLKPRGTPLKLEGRPSRTRIAPGGRLGATTVFVVGDDYTSASFSTRTTIVDLKSGAALSDLEQFSTFRNGSRFSSPDFNFWGVTFGRDENTFYASLRTGGATYLVRGDIAARTLTVLRDNVECPSLSPDGRLIAFKKQVGPDPGAWRLAILELQTMTERLVAAETRYIDDQVEWLDPGTILYAVPRRTTRISDVWTAPVEGAGPARIFLPEAESPIVIR